ncbi:MAG: LamG domain-containing protein [Phycisphaerales bacterium]|nr:MAG: LamG domain-containing protein [Phycisphaerales bacterium]
MYKNMLFLMAIVLMLGLVADVAEADLIVAEELLVDLRADDLADGEVTSWPNRGTLGDFTAQGAPVVETVDGMRAVTFDGGSWFDGPVSTPGIEGAGTRSIEVWAHNPSIPGEETTVSWAHRGGPAGTNMAFNYGNDNLWGAVGHWEGETHDMGWWGSHTPAPAANTWWHLAYTYDGTAARVYVNGVQESVRDPIDLDTYGGTPIRVAAQADTTGAAADTGFNFTGSIAEVRIHDGVLSPSDIVNNFNEGGVKKAHKPSPADGAFGVQNPLFQWSAGMTAASHDVYFGTNPSPGPAEFIMSQTWTVYYHVAGLIPGTTYYWRIDETESDGVTVHTGDVWSFTAAPMTAYQPGPPDGAKFQDPDVALTWMPGVDAASHDLYFGTSRADVENGTGDTFKGNLTELTLTFDPGPLSSGTTYYWRIDETDDGGATHVGEVWSFTTIPEIVVSDPSLVGWWKFDEGQGSVAVDWSGQGNHGAIRGGTEWIDGYDGGALRLKGQDGYVNLPIGAVIASMDSTTITTWVNFSNLGGSWQRIFDFGSGTPTYLFLCPRTGTAGVMHAAIQVGDQGHSEVNAPETLPTGWHHVAVVVTSGSMQLYLDGQVLDSGTAATVPSDLGNTSSNWLGRSQFVADGYFNGSLDDFRIYNRVLSKADIAETMRGDPSLAWKPQPADWSVPDVEMAAQLAWLAGDGAVQHDVYFGTEEDAVADADTSDTTGVYKGRQGAASYIPPALEKGKTYYWRIDEVSSGGTVNMGRIWSFTVAEYLIVDDFEDYNDYSPDRIFQTWIDGFGYTDPPPGKQGNGTGSTVGYLNAPFAEQTIVHGDAQSMPFGWDNTAFPFYSEAEREFPMAQDFTRKGVKSLSLWVYGDAGNSPSVLYVGLQDSAGTRIDVPETSTSLVQAADWQEVTVELSEFAPVNLVSIKKIYFGAGSRVSPSPGGVGNIFVDDIRLYGPRCVASRLKPANDLNDDCVVNYLDLDIVVNEWLTSGHLVTPVDPGTSGLVARYALDGNANDSVGGYHGTPGGTPVYGSGYLGQAIRCDGVDDYVELPIGSLIGSLTNCTLAAWANFSNAGGGWQRIFDFGNDTVTYMFLTPRMGTDGPMRFGITIEGGGTPEQLVTAPATLPTGWHHVAVTIDADNDTITLYQDGVAVAQNTEATLSPSDLGPTTNNWLGRSQYVADAYYLGLIDDFRILDRAVSGPGVAWLAGKTAPFSEAFDLNADDAVDFGDFTILGDSWLDELLWPAP